MHLHPPPWQVTWNLTPFVWQIRSICILSGTCGITSEKKERLGSTSWHVRSCFTWRRSNWVWELYIIFAGLILLLPKLGLDESQEVLLVHTWRVMDVGINFPHIVEISMGCTFLGQEFTVRIQHQMKTKFLQKILQRNDIDFRVQNPKMVVVLKVHHDDFKPANSLEQWMR